MMAMITRALLGLLLLLGTWACDDVERSDVRGTRAGPTKAKVAEAAAEAEAKPEPVVYKDEDFVESIRNRDPFISYTQAFRAKPPEAMQRRVIMPTTTIEEMRLVAIVTGMPRPTAMLVDPLGMGHVVQRGDYVGRPKVIQATGSVSMTLNWRIDRIRDNEVVLTQQDPADPTRTALTKIMKLNEKSEMAHL